MSFGLPRLALLVMLVALAGCTETPQVEVISNPATAPVPVDPAEAARIINAFRADNGVPPVRVNAALNAIAQDYADRLAAYGQLTHELGGNLASRLRRGGYAYLAAGENLGAGYRSIDEAVARWEASPGHRANLLEAPLTQMGIATAFNIDSPYRTFWVLVLAAPR